MAGMTKKQLICQLAESAGCSRALAGRVLESLVKTAYSEAASGFIIPGLCKIEVVDRKARRCRDPRTGIGLLIGARKGVRIRPLKKAKDAMAPLSPGAVVIVEEPPAHLPERADNTPSVPEPSAPASEPVGTLAGEGDQVFIYFRCLSCGQEIEAPPDMAGSISGCPVCGNSFRVPEVAGLPVPDPVPDDEESSEMNKLLMDAMKNRTVRIELPQEDISALASPGRVVKKKIIFRGKGTV